MDVARDSNPMLQGGMNPVMRLGVIPGKAHPDIAYIRECQANAENSYIASDCYPGGAKDINHDIMPGDIILGRKCVRNSQVNNGEMNELGIASLAGTELPGGYSMQWLDDQFYFVGMAVTECRQSDPFGNPRAQDPDSGFATIKVGTVSVINNNVEKPFYAGDLVCWRCPRRNDEHQRAVAQGARMGTVASQIKPELYPFDYTDGTASIHAAVVNIAATKAQQGISDIPFQEFVSRDGRGIDTEFAGYNEAQETAAAMKYAIAGILQGALDSGVTLQKTIDEMLDSNNAAGQNNFADLIQKIFQHSFVMGQNTAGTKLYASSSLDDKKKKLREMTGQFFSNFSHGAWAHKTGNIIGRALAYSAPGDTLHVMLGHTITK